ncbi:hypothetical protein ACSNOK_34070, partial [Streptomyces sp. URMC 126]|uniref:hypothetical protein n=1 Tax=Streptomyces sp. URMC 126 TaxID=3423401 RepID=UPI003F19E102
QTGLQMLRAYTGQIVGRQREGARQITIGENAIVINVTDSGNPQTTAETIFNNIKAGIGDAVNQASTNIKY